MLRGYIRVLRWKNSMIRFFTLYCLNIYQFIETPMYFALLQALVFSHGKRMQLSLVFFCVLFITLLIYRGWIPFPTWFPIFESSFWSSEASFSLRMDRPIMLSSANKLEELYLTWSARWLTAFDINSQSMPHPIFRSFFQELILRP